MSLFNRWIEGIAKRAVHDTITKPGPTRDRIDQIIREVHEQHMRDDPVYRFHIWIGRELCRCGLPIDQVRESATDCLRSHLKDEKIRFGDPGYGWTKADAVELAQEWLRD